MQKAGAVAFTDAGHPVANAQLMRNALEYATDFGITIFSHAEDTRLSSDGHINEGIVSTRLGLRGMPTIAEESFVSRDTMLAEYTGAKLHFCQNLMKFRQNRLRNRLGWAPRVLASAPDDFLGL